jgi:SAM-dependent methyltransferase
MFGVDVAPTFVRAGHAMETERGGKIGYVVGSGVELPFAEGSFDFATALMSLMDLPEHDRALAEIHRVLRPGGFLQFSITHPCFSTPHRRLLRNASGEAYAVEVGRYFERVEGEVERWIFGAAPAEERAGLAPFEVPIFRRTLSEWLNALTGVGFGIEEVGEPRADDETALAEPRVQDTQVVAYFLHVRCRKS